MKKNNLNTEAMMKKYIFLTFLVLFGCTQTSSISTLPESREQNEKCMDMKRFQVFQVLEDNYALAHACSAKGDSSYCSGAVVLLTPKRNIAYYDEMYVWAPENKCAVQEGVFKYETKNKTYKTVPIIRFDYEFGSSSPEEALERFHETMEDMRYECKLSASSNKKQNTKANLNKCDCVVDFFTNEFLALKDKTDVDKEKFEQEFFKRLEKKCGKMPDFIKN